MRTDRRLLTRWVLGVAAVLGLLAMHGLTASTASASAECGGMPAHAHGASAPEAASVPEAASAPEAAAALEPGPVTTMGVDLSGLDAGHAGALCVAILLMGVVLAVMARNGRRPEPVRIRSRHGIRPSRGVRAPPDRADLSVWRN